MLIAYDELKSLVKKIFIKKGLTDIEADSISHSLVDGEAKGKHHHGLVLIDFYLKQIDDKKNDPQIEYDMKSFCIVDGGDVLGPVAADYACDLAVKRANDYGVSFVGVHNKSPFAMAGTHAEKIAASNCVGIVMCNSKARVAPIGSYEPVFGPNPIAFGFPKGKKESPLVFDFATSGITMGEIRRLLTVGGKVPAGLAYDVSGNPTSDPEKALKGCVTPFGGYKGYALMTAIEILAGPLVRAKAGKSVPGTRGFLVGAFSLNGREDEKNIFENIELLLNEIKEAKKIDGVNDIRIPGERSAELSAQSKKQGIEISPLS